MDYHILKLKLARAECSERFWKRGVRSALAKRVPENTAAASARLLRARTRRVNAQAAIVAFAEANG